MLGWLSLSQYAAATASSGLIDVSPSMPVSSLSIFCTIGIRVEPPVSSTRWIAFHSIPAAVISRFVV